MKSLFIPYELAVKAKEKGFDQPVFAVIYPDGQIVDQIFGKLYLSEKEKQKDPCIPLPLYQQLVDWFREYCWIEITIYSINERNYAYIILSSRRNGVMPKDFSLTLVDQVLFKEKKGIKSISVKEFEEMNLSYYDAFNKAFEEAFKLI